MCALKVPAVGENVLLDWAIMDAAPGNLLLRLYKNDITPGDSDTAATYTEADFTSYTEKSLTRAGWSAVTQVSNKASITFGTAQTWTNTGASQTVYGYYVVTDEGTPVLVWAERFDSPRTLGTSDTLSVTPVLTLESEN